MADRWREKTDNYSSSANYQRGWRQRSKNRQPPLPGGGGGGENRSLPERDKSFSGGIKRSVPEWEKSFCATVGLVPWPRLLEAKKSMFLYQDILKWEDSACKEAFRNAKSWYWAKMKGLPCDHLKVSDPDIYIDEIDWDAGVDNELLMDLERDPHLVRDQEFVNVEADKVVILGLNEDEKKPTAGGETGWGVVEKNPVCLEGLGWGDSNELYNGGWCDWGVCMTIEDDWRDWNGDGWSGHIGGDCDGNGRDGRIRDHNGGNGQGRQTGDWNDDGWGGPLKDRNEDGWAGGPTKGWNDWNEDDHGKCWDSNKQPNNYIKPVDESNNAWLGWQRNGGWRRTTVGDDNYYHNSGEKGARNQQGGNHQFDRGWKSAAGSKINGRNRVEVGYYEPEPTTTWVDKKKFSGRW